MIYSDNWPPIYSVKRHSRSKCVKLKATLKNGLELVVPTRFNLKHIPKILVENKAWIEKQLLKLAQLEQDKSNVILPNKIFLRAINQTWNIEYIESQNPLKIIHRPHQEIAIVGEIQDKTYCKKLLIHWLKQLANIYLKNHLSILSQKIQLPYNKVTIRDQETRWGSCTKDKNISLNYKLIFLPEHLASHIMIHELCHTVHLNHSDNFWKLVGKFDSDWQENRVAARKVDEFIPKWLVYIA